MSYINIDKALESIDLIAKNDAEKFDKDSARYAIQTTETADVQEVKHGEWVKQDTSFDLCGVDYYRCSLCGKETQTRYPNCPYCGAEMGGKKESEKQAYWLIGIDKNNVEADIMCSSCGYSYIEADPNIKQFYNYCPNCGKEMRNANSDL